MTRSDTNRRPTTDRPTATLDQSDKTGLYWFPDTPALAERRFGSIRAALSAAAAAGFAPCKPGWLDL